MLPVRIMSLDSILFQLGRACLWPQAPLAQRLERVRDAVRLGYWPPGKSQRERQAEPSEPSATLTLWAGGAAVNAMVWAMFFGACRQYRRFDRGGKPRR